MMTGRRGSVIKSKMDMPHTLPETFHQPSAGCQRLELCTSDTTTGTTICRPLTLAVFQMESVADDTVSPGN